MNLHQHLFGDTELILVINWSANDRVEQSLVYDIIKLPIFETRAVLLDGHVANIHLVKW